MSLLALGAEVVNLLASEPGDAASVATYLYDMPSALLSGRTPTTASLVGLTSD